MAFILVEANLEDPNKLPQSITDSIVFYIRDDWASLDKALFDEMLLGDRFLPTILHA
jgi:hypothetical protein